ncbi:LUD domain-containing protein [Prescottella equi]|uniref:Lactate utilization protein C n=1 Tax=Rhodococcus hoagii TaxID=43767 RepID=A0A9Q2Z4I3_RHOHA|nr:LUD domain-containing protein [Prescottella equi]MBM4487155.1 lactate utilization protein C [Prescottella equi]MBM4495868.1 lactate utilization protein C [Prescottella equi]MBM4499949.1 lactate utilization protein C [Prescottella equi]MBM4505133.1 lactate utilization protein C [Prescottella equi]MBM4516382.1 lactate utilization protein C [Prescottella equi]
MSSRDVIMGRIRDALTLAPPKTVVVPREYRTGRTMPDADRVELLVDRLVDYKAVVHRSSVAELPDVLVRVLTEVGARRVGVPAGLDNSWLSRFDGEVVVDSPTVPAPQLGDLDGVVTASAVSCAETGTIFLDGSPDQGRRALTLVPDLHVCVVTVDSIEVGVPEAMARLVPERPTTMISGPSATSDIELERVEGVHGPRNLHVVIVGPTEALH